ncbi:MAG: hypothetical protein ACI4VQ_06255 [Clostridia bacterium]
MESLEELNREELTDVLNMIGQIIEKLVPKNYGFIMLTYPHNEAKRLYYISNSNREDVIKAMEEFIDKTQNSWGEHKDLED